MLICPNLISGFMRDAKPACPGLILLNIIVKEDGVNLGRPSDHTHTHTPHPTFNITSLWPQRIAFQTECTKIAHRRLLAIFTADEGIVRNSAARIIFTCFHRRKKSRFASGFLRRGNRASWGLKRRPIFPGAVKITAATAENRNFGALRFQSVMQVAHDTLELGWMRCDREHRLLVTSGARFQLCKDLALAHHRHQLA